MRPRRGRIVFLGQRRWSEVLAEGINGLPDGRLSAVAVPLDGPLRALSAGSLAALARADVLVRVGFRPGADTPMGRGFERFWAIVRRLNPHARTILYWIGSDVASAVEQVRSGSGRERMYRLIAQSRNIAGSGPLGAELASIGIQAETVGFPWTTATFPDSPPPLPGKFSVLTYIPDHRAAFYGGPTIAEAARSLPDVAFDVVGGTGSWVEAASPNLRFHGWQAHTPAWFLGASAVVRLVEHDSIGGTAIEGLLYARHVVYSLPLPHTVLVDRADPDALAPVISDLEHRHSVGRLGPNVDGWEYARAAYDPGQRLRQLADVLRSEGAKP